MNTPLTTTAFCSPLHYFIADNKCAFRGEVLAPGSFKCSRRQKFTWPDGFILSPFPHVCTWDWMASRGKSARRYAHQQEPPRTNRHAICRWRKWLFFQVCQDVHLFHPACIWARSWLQAATATVHWHRHKGSETNRLELKLVGSSRAVRSALTTRRTWKKKSNKAANCGTDGLRRKRTAAFLNTRTSGKMPPVVFRHVKGMNSRNWHKIYRIQ